MTTKKMTNEEYQELMQIKGEHEYWREELQIGLENINNASWTDKYMATAEFLKKIEELLKNNNKILMFF